VNKNVMSENDRLRKALSDRMGERSETSIAMENIKMKKKLGERITPADVIAAKGVKIISAREWHEGKKSE